MDITSFFSVAGIASGISGLFSTGVAIYNNYQNKKIDNKKIRFDLIYKNKINSIENIREVNAKFFESLMNLLQVRSMVGFPKKYNSIADMNSESQKILNSANNNFFYHGMKLKSFFGVTKISKNDEEKASSLLEEHKYSEVFSLDNNDIKKAYIQFHIKKLIESDKEKNEESLITKMSELNNVITEYLERESKYIENLI